mmetsp:Transcript_53350/g.109226  ORF Transcript_53350/g.109226 Transcript_53350/m.109226 type:complete len:97 (+) Transcript_53350:1144-1434(+)
MLEYYILQRFEFDNSPGNNSFRNNLDTSDMAFVLCCLDDHAMHKNLNRAKISSRVERIHKDDYFRFHCKKIISKSEEEDDDDDVISNHYYFFQDCR